MGNLIRDEFDDIDVDWTVYDKVREVTTASGPDLFYLYDAGGNLLAKMRVEGSDINMDFYIRDASGNVMSIYEKNINAPYSAYSQKEVHLYGSSRLGIRKFDDRNINIGGPIVSGSVEPIYQRTRGQKLFEFSNHLGNTLVTLTDQKLGTEGSTSGIFDFYTSTAVSTSDYYPFGLAIGARTVSSDEYRYGFNGKENDTEWGERMIQDYGFRLYNHAIAKFLSVDPLAQSFPWNSPFSFAENDVIRAIDLDGLEKAIIIERYADGEVMQIDIIEAKDNFTEKSIDFGAAGPIKNFSSEDILLLRIGDTRGLKSYEKLENGFNDKHREILAAGADITRTLRFHIDAERGDNMGEVGGFTFSGVTPTPNTNRRGNSLLFSIGRYREISNTTTREEVYDKEIPIPPKSFFPAFGIIPLKSVTSVIVPEIPDSQFKSLQDFANKMERLGAPKIIVNVRMFMSGGDFTVSEMASRISVDLKAKLGYSGQVEANITVLPTLDGSGNVRVTVEGGKVTKKATRKVTESKTTRVLDPN